MNPPGPGAAAVRAQHRPRILAGRVSVAAGWGQPCLSYLLCIRPAGAAQARLAAAQDAISGAERSLLRVPPHALHVSVAWLLPVHEEFGRPKDELWAQYGPGWLAGIGAALRRVPPFRLRMRHLVATDTAVIAVAADPNPVTALRANLAGALARPGKLPLSRGELVHTTLFRYGGALTGPAAFLDRVAAAGDDLDVGIAVHEMFLVREEIFPSLSSKTIHRFALAPGSPGGVAHSADRATLCPDPAPWVTGTP